MAEIDARLAETISEFNFLPNNIIFQKLHGIRNLAKKNLKANAAPQALLPKPARAEDWMLALHDSPLVCIEIGLAEIERAAGTEAEHISTGEIASVTATALQRRPEHLADILLVANWMFAEALCTEAQREAVRLHFLTVAESVEGVLS